MKILVTGANGYLGQGIVKKLLDLGYTVIAADVSVENIDKRAIVKKVDIFNIQNPYIYFEKPDILVHMAWRDGFQHYSYTHIEDLPKHFIFLEKIFQSNIQKVIVMGSMHEIGFFEGCVNEYTPCNPVTPYGVSKNALRNLSEMLSFKYNKKLLWLRAYYIIGENHRGSSVFSKIVMAVKNGEKEFPFTSGENQYDFITYEEFCQQVVKSIIQDKFDGIINICSGNPEKLSIKVEQFIKENNLPITLKYGVYPDRIYDSKAIWGNSEKILKILNL